MSSSPALSTLTVIGQKGDRTTGSPLLDSFVLAPKTNTTYISPIFNQRPANTRNLQGRREGIGVMVEGPLRLHSLPPAPIESPAPSPEQLPKQSSQVAPTPKLPPSARALISTTQASEATAVEKKRLSDSSLERAAAVGMLDLSDKLLFGGEDDALISDYLGGEDPLLTGGDETAVFRYLSKQIAESTLTKIKSRLPLAVQPQLEIEANKVVLDARNFKVFADAVLKADSSKPNEAEQPSKNESVQETSEPPSEDLSMSQQIALLNEKVELLTKALSTLTASAPQTSATSPVKS